MTFSPGNYFDSETGESTKEYGIYFDSGNMFPHLREHVGWVVDHCSLTLAQAKRICSLLNERYPLLPRFPSVDVCHAAEALCYEVDEGMMPPIKVEACAKALSERFSMEVRSSLSADDLAEVNRRNTVYAGSKDSTFHQCCASHDFYDANMSMWDAHIAVFGREMDCNTRWDASVCNAAWDMSKAAGFAGGAA